MQFGGTFDQLLPRFKIKILRRGTGLPIYFPLPLLVGAFVRVKNPRKEAMHLIERQTVAVVKDG